MNPATKAPAWAALLPICIVIAGCGGGGGGSDPTTNQPPVAAAALTGEAVLGAPTAFSTTGTRDPDGTLATRTWAYGDGQTGTSDSHVYAAAGNYTASYTVTDNSGASASTTVAVAVAKCSAAGTNAARLSPSPTVCVQTSRGEMVFEVYPTQAPVTAANFLQYVDEGFYAGTIFHRVIARFVIQAGGYTPGPTAKTPTHGPIVLESNNGLQNWQYTLAMARTPVANSATSQFFVNLVDNHGLDYVSAANPGYAVFGLVISGTAVVDAIGVVATGNAGGLADVPVQDVVIQSIVRMP